MTQSISYILKCISTCHLCFLLYEKYSSILSLLFDLHSSKVRDPYFSQPICHVLGGLALSPPPIILIPNLYFSRSCSKLSLFANMYPMNILRNIAFQPLHSTLFILTAGLQAFSTSALMWRTANVHLNNVSNIWLLIFWKFSPPMNFTSVLILLSIPMVKNWTFPIPRIGNCNYF